MEKVQNRGDGTPSDARSMDGRNALPARGPRAAKRDPENLDGRPAEREADTTAPAVASATYAAARRSSDLPPVAERPSPKGVVGPAPDSTTPSLPSPAPNSDALWDKTVFTRTAMASTSPDFHEQLAAVEALDAPHEPLPHPPLEPVVDELTGEHLPAPTPFSRQAMVEQTGQESRHLNLLDSEDPSDALLRPRTAFFDQRDLAHLTDAQVKEVWNDSPRTVGHDEEEAMAREIIERQIARGEVDTGFMIAHFVDRSESVAGEAARVATDWMWATQDRKQLNQELWLLGIVVACCFFFGAYLVYRYKSMKKRLLQRPDLRSTDIDPKTMLPYWGNDGQYESAVKRIFLDEFKKARSAALRGVAFQKGMAREGMQAAGKEEDARQMDLAIFDVSTEHLGSIREAAELRRRRKDRK